MGEKITTIGALLDRYNRDVIPTKAKKTQVDNKKQLIRIRMTFGTWLLSDIQPSDIYQYMDKRTAKVAGKREIALLSHAYTKAVEWGYLNRHPFKGEVRLRGEKPRTRYVDDAEIIECLTLRAVRKRGSVRSIQSYIRLKLLTGLRRGDLLRLRSDDCREDGIHVRTNKSGKSIVYEWSPELRGAVEGARSARPVDISPLLFCTKHGKCYVDDSGIASGWDSMWQRFMERVLKETKVSERFTEHDLRAKAASDAGSLEHARALLAHADSRLTERVYRRKPERVKPLR